jgi:hypothetical protein
MRQFTIPLTGCPQSCRQTLVQIAAAVAAFASLIAPATAQSLSAHFDVNDISFLWPAPNSSAEVNQLISLDDTFADGSPILSGTILDLILDSALHAHLTQSSGAPSQITFPDVTAFRTAHNWKVVGMRVDPSAPGANARDIGLFGSQPQVRLIVQPVTVDADGVHIHDFAMHLVFDFITGFEPAAAPGFPQRAIPDKVAFRSVLDNLRKIQALMQSANVSTAGELSVHPGFRSNVPGFTDALKSLIKTQLNGNRLAATAFMGVQDESEPWIFFAMVMQNGQLVPFPHPSLNGSLAQMLTFRGGSPVVPTPVNSNFPEGGVSTAILFSGSASQNLDASLSPQSTRPDMQQIKLRDIPDIIANPQISDFPNSDCISCHSESTRRHDLNANSGTDGFAYQRPTGISGVSTSVLPTDRWNVRNFGWSPFNSPPETITMRAANEAAASADFINREYFGQPTPASSPTTSGAIGIAVNLGTAPPSAALPSISPSNSVAAMATPTPISTPVPSATPVSNALTLVMTIKSPQDFQQLKVLLAAQQNPSQSTINTAMNNLGIVHFARFVFLGEDKLMVITNYDGDFDRYIGAFTAELGPIFDDLLSHMADAPPLPVQQHQKEFLDYVSKRDLSRGQPGYSAYPQLKVQDILTLQKKANP